MGRTSLLYRQDNATAQVGQHNCTSRPCVTTLEYMKDNTSVLVGELYG